MDLGGRINKTQCGGWWRESLRWSISRFWGWATWWMVVIFTNNNRAKFPDIKKGLTFPLKMAWWVLSRWMEKTHNHQTQLIVLQPQAGEMILKFPAQKQVTTTTGRRAPYWHLIPREHDWHLEDNGAMRMHSGKTTSHLENYWKSIWAKLKPFSHPRIQNFYFPWFSSDGAC